MPVALSAAPGLHPPATPLNVGKPLRKCGLLSDFKMPPNKTRWAMSSPRLIKGRRSEIGHYYSITTCTAGRSRLFADPIAAQCVIAELKATGEVGVATTFAWVVMPDHLHWLFRLERSSISDAVQRMKCASANRINAARQRHGSVWQAGFCDRRIRTEEDLNRHMRYIIENPVRAGIVARIDEYPLWGCDGLR